MKDRVWVDSCRTAVVNGQHLAPLKEWAIALGEHVARVPRAVVLYRMGSDCDYMIKAVTQGIRGYNRFYQRLADGSTFRWSPAVTCWRT